MRPPALRLLPLLAFPLALAGCRDSSTVSYRIPKENDAPAAAPQPAPHPAAAPHPPIPAAGTAPAAPAGGNMADTAVIKADGPGLQWTAPAHWRTKPASAMRKATFAIDGEGGATADLSVTAFPGDVGGELANVNRWRGQLSLAPLAEPDLAAAVTRREQGSLHLTIVDLAGSGAAAGQRMLGAIVPFGGATWFFKLTGPDALVAREKPAFLEFLQTLRTP